MTGSIIKFIVLSLWLPMGVLAVGQACAASVGRAGLPNPTDILWLLALTWPASLPLTLAVRLMHNRSRAVAYVCAVILGVLSVCSIFLGMYLGFLGMIVSVLAMSVPAWMVLGILIMVGNRGARQSPNTL